MPITFPSPFPAHQGLILPVVRKWPDRFDAVALCIGAAMPDLADITLGFAINGYFKQWVAHSIIGIFLIDIPGGMLLTWVTTMLITRWLKNDKLNTPHKWHTRLRLWNFSVTSGVISHLALDLISHETNLLLFPWYENLKWFPDWWYTPWWRIQLAPPLGHSYTVGIHTVIWLILSVIGTVMFYQYLFEYLARRKKKSID